ncbi:Probable lipoprotein precursor [Tenacibaculum maritimum]|nr:Probable lipoprotein precursor [Tenacibaculum maritimum]
MKTMKKKLLGLFSLLIISCSSNEESAVVTPKLVVKTTSIELNKESNDTYTQVTDYMYNDNYELTSLVTIAVGRDGEQDKNRVDFQYTNGKVTRIAQKEEENVLRSYSIFEYTAEKLTKITKYNSSNIVIGIEEFAYNANSKVETMTKTSYFNNSENVDVEKYEYLADNKVKIITTDGYAIVTLDNKKNHLASIAAFNYLLKTEYKALNNEVARESYDKDGTLKREEKYVNKYDTADFIIEQVEESEDYKYTLKHVYNR